MGATTAHHFKFHENIQVRMSYREIKSMKIKNCAAQQDKTKDAPVVCQKLP
jgi:hypothetical protein